VLVAQRIADLPAGASGVPPTIVATVLAQLHRVDERTRDALERLAVILSTVELRSVEESGLVPARARAQQLTAPATLDGMAAKPLARRIRQQLRQSGVTRTPRVPTPSTRDNLAGLTGRQMANRPPTRRWTEQRRDRDVGTQSLS